MKKNGKIIISAILALIFISVFLLVSFSLTFLPKNKEDVTEHVRIRVPNGTSTRELSRILYDEGIIRSANSFYLGVRFPILNKIFIHSENPFSLKSGIYKLSSSMSVKEIYDILTSGRQEYIKVSIPEGLTKSKVGQRLEEAEVCSKEDFIASVMNEKLLKKYQIPSESFEGYLFPDTYFFTPMMESDEVVSIMVDNFFDHISKIDNLKTMDRKTLDYTVRLASIVEREYRLDTEAPLIASVFKNRLRWNWGLYSCATVEYILTEIEGRNHPDVITYADLKIDSPYNTYKYAGLPPTAISNPGAVALDAAANAPRTKYCYFRLVDPEIGKHVFTEDFSQHISEGYSYSTKKSGK